MEAHTPAIGIGTRRAAKPRRRRLAELLTMIRRRRTEGIERAYNRQASGVRQSSLPGSEHAHLLRRPRGF